MRGFPFRPPRPGDAPHRLAVIDVGTNTVLATIFGRTDGGAHRVDEDLHFVTGLGRGRGPRGELSEAGMKRALAALQVVANRLDRHEVGGAGIRAVTTAAVREAPNGRAFVEAVEARWGITLAVISGDEEAALCGLAQARSWPLEPGIVVLDIGGGSTEWVGVEGGSVRWTRSVPIGSVKLGEQGGASLADLEGAIEPWRSQMPGVDTLADARFIAVAGTATTALQLVRGQGVSDPEALHGAALTLDELVSTRDAVAALDPVARARLPGLHPGRAPFIVAGLSLLVAAMQRAGRQEVVVSDRGVRWGLLFRHWPRVRVTEGRAAA